MAPFDRPYTTFYWSAIVNIALSCTVFEFSLLCALPFQAVPGVQWRQSSLLWALFIWSYSMTLLFIQKGKVKGKCIYIARFFCSTSVTFRDATSWLRTYAERCLWRTVTVGPVRRTSCLFTVMYTFVWFGTLVHFRCCKL